MALVILILYKKHLELGLLSINHLPARSACLPTMQAGGNYFISMKSSFTNPIVIVLLIVLGYIGILTFKNPIIDYLNDEAYNFIKPEHAVGTLFNVLYTLLAFWLIKKYKLIDLAGLGNAKLKKGLFLLFPLYIVLISAFELEMSFKNVSALSILSLALYTLSVGFAEEYIMRGFVQSLLLKHYGYTKRGIILSVVGSAFLFGLMHLLKFDNGLWGEITQVLYATFIGTMFGAILLRAHKIWPLVIIHGLVDFFGLLNTLVPISKIVEETSTQSQITISNIITLIVLLPCFIYGLILLRKINPESLRLKYIQH